MILRNGWYTENYTAGIPIALQYGVMMGCAGGGKIASAARADYAEAAATVLLASNPAGKGFELAGDEAYTLDEFASKLSQQAGQTISYQNLTQDDYLKALQDAGLPAQLAVKLAESETEAAKGELFDSRQTLSQLIRRLTTTLCESIEAALAT